METSQTPEPGAGPERGHGGRARGDVPQAPAENWWGRLWKPFWTLPAACVLAALIVGIVLPLAEESWGTTRLQYVFQGGPDGAREVLGTIASAMISVTALVFSITIVVLQLASSQFTPRALGGFLQSRIVQGTLGIFIATFIFALTVTRYVRGSNVTEQFVPQVSVTLAFVLVLACMGFFLAFIHHITTTIQVSHVVSRIGDETLQTARLLYPERADDLAPAFGPTWSPTPHTPHRGLAALRHGVITYVDYPGLVHWASRHDVVVSIDRSVGEFLVEGQDLLTVWGTAELDAEESQRLYRFVGVGPQRETRQDVAFGIRQLVDITDRALSPGVNDPTTALQCLDELHRILRHLVQRASPSPYITDDQGQVRVVHHPQPVSDLIRLAVLEPAHYGQDAFRLHPRLRALLQDLLQVTAGRYRDTIQGLLETLPGPEDDPRPGRPQRP
jgi:uncharacterized membrane protein